MQRVSRGAPKPGGTSEDSDDISQACVPHAWQTPLVTSVAVLSLALGIAVNTAILESLLLMSQIGP